MVHRRRLLTLLEQQARLERMARIVGKDALPAEQQLTLLAADLVNESFLRQSAFSPADRYCSPKRQTAMLRLIMRFIDLAEEAVANGVPVERIAALPVLRTLQRLGEEYPEDRIEALAEVAASVEADVGKLAPREVEHAG
jgi:V/A-type H+-transporting ATPase subunit A